MDRRVLTRNIESDHEVGKVGPEQVQLYSQDGKLYAQLSSNDAVLITDLMAGTAVTPVGVVNAFAGSDTAPAGWLLCNSDVVTNGSGTVQSQTADFSDLYALLGTTYGSAGTLPDLAGRVIAQEDGTYARGVEGGAVGVGLVAGNVPAHNHGLTATINSTVSDNSSVDGYGTPWSHDATDVQVIPNDPYAPHDSWRMAEIYTGGTWDVQPEDSQGIDRPYLNMRADKDWDHYFDVTSEFAGSSTTDNSTGTGSNHENRQPTLYMNYIIKF